jgi:hypothetical protein
VGPYRVAADGGGRSRSRTVVTQRAPISDD